MPLNQNSLKDTLKQKIDLHVVVSRYVSLKQTGNKYIGLCPFHQEKTPSFHVYSDKQFFHCFGCKISGDIFTFKMQKENLTFSEAIESLAQEFQIEMPKTFRNSHFDETKKLYSLNQMVCDWFEKQLQSQKAEHARKYLQTRNISLETIKKFHIGFAVNDWQALKQFLEANKLPLSQAESLGLIKTHPQKKTQYDAFRNRIMFPIFDEKKRIIGFGGRTLDTQSKQAKYINSSASTIYQKDNEFYSGPDSFSAIRKTKKVIIVEGYFDLISLYQKGITNVLASCGTAFTTFHARKLKRYAEEIIIFYDSDNAGMKAVFTAGGILLKEGMTVKICSLSKEKDPDEYCQKHPVQEIQDLIGNAISFIEFIILKQEQKLSLAISKNPIVNRLSFFDAIEPYLSLFQNSIEKNEWLRFASRKLQIPEEELFDEMRKRILKKDYHSVQTKDNSKNTITDYYRPEITFIIMLLLDPTLIEKTETDDTFDMLKSYFLSGDSFLQSFFSAFQFIKEKTFKQESTNIHDVLVFFHDGKTRSYLVSTFCSDNVHEEFPVDKHTAIFQDCLKKIRNRFLKLQKQKIEREMIQNEQKPDIAESLLKKKIEIDKEITTLALK